MAVRERPLGYRISRLLHYLRQQRFLILLGARGCGVEIRGGHVLLRRVRRGARPRLVRVRRRPSGLVVVHGPNLVARAGDLKFPNRQ